MAATKIRYQSRSVEQHIDRPRSDIWPDVLAMVRSWEPSAELAVEPPWRIAYEMATDGSPLTFWQSTVMIRDDGPTCHVAWGLVFDPEPSDDALAEAVCGHLEQHHEVHNDSRSVRGGERLGLGEVEWFVADSQRAVAQIDHDVRHPQPIECGAGAGGQSAHPLDGDDARGELREDRSLLPSAIEEMLRWVTPIQNMNRTATRDVTLGGQRIREGDRMLLLYPSANRDEDAFSQPDRFDIRRHPNDHVAFGGFGRHHCLGAQLATSWADCVDQLCLAELSCCSSRRLDGEKYGPVCNPVPLDQHVGQHTDYTAQAV